MFFKRPDRRAFALVTALVIGAISRPISAQQPEREIDGRPDAELAEDGWEFQAGSSTAGSGAAAALAVLVGPVWHGVGHFYLGERQMGRVLLYSEALALGLLGTGSLMGAVSDREGVDTAGAALRVAGTSMFVAGWLADILGSVRGSAPRPDPGTTDIEGITLDAFYSSILNDDLGFSNIAVLRAPIFIGGLVAVPEVEIESRGRYLSGAGYAGWRFALTPPGSTWLEVGGGGRDEQQREDGYGRTQVFARTAFALDAGHILPHLSGLVWGFRAEGLAEWRRYDVTDGSRFASSRQVWRVPLESWIGFAVGRGAGLTVGYRRRNDLLVGSAGDRTGVYYTRLVVVPQNRIGIELGVDQGTFTRIWTGLRLIAWTPSRGRVP